MGNTNGSSPKPQAGIDSNAAIMSDVGGSSVRDGAAEGMVESPAHSPSGVARSPLPFDPQMPLVPFSRPEEFTTEPLQHEGSGSGGTSEGKAIPTMIVWSYGGNEVFVEGSWDDWTQRHPLQKVGKDFILIKVLPAGEYQYRFILDPDYEYSPEVLSKINNVINVQDHVPDNLDNMASFDPPRSPASSYGDTISSVEDFPKEPPLLPPQLHLTVLNLAPDDEESSGALPRPQHVSLEHLYVEKRRDLHSAFALALTHRYRSKYVTVALYKPVSS